MFFQTDLFCFLLAEKKNLQEEKLFMPDKGASTSGRPSSDVPSSSSKQADFIHSVGAGVLYRHRSPLVPAFDNTGISLIGDDLDDDDINEEYQPDETDQKIFKKLELAYQQLVQDPASKSNFTSEKQDLDGVPKDG